MYQQYTVLLRAITGRIFRSNLIFGLFRPGFNPKSLFGFGLLFSGLGRIGAYCGLLVDNSGA